MPSREPQADELANIERFDPLAPLRNRLRSVAGTRNDAWAGVPMPLDGEQLVIEPRHIMAAAFNRQDGAPEDYRVRNTFWSARHRCKIVVFEEPDGRITWGRIPGIHHLDHDLRTLGCAAAWGIEQEGNAVHLLGTLLNHHRFKQYMLTGTFLESSERSGVTYLFRRLRPTIALVARKERMRILCALCMHPIAYYAESWAGAMCPTDDVIAHLMLMRGDEAMLWRRCNQHPAWRPEAGL